jgi:segregation and condensation protein B
MKPDCPEVEAFGNGLDSDQEGCDQPGDGLPAGCCTVLEALLFAAPKPLSLKEIQQVLQGALDDARMTAEEEGALSDAVEPGLIAMAEMSIEDIRLELDRLARGYLQDPARGFHLVEVADGYQLATKPGMAPWLRSLLEDRRKNLLTRAALETLAVIAYRQPVTRADVEDVRGVSVDGVMRSLLEKGLIRIVGKSDLPGRPMLYETGPLFLEHFGLRSVKDLPAYMELSQAPLQSRGKAAEWMGDEEDGNDGEEEQ